MVLRKRAEKRAPNAVNRNSIMSSSRKAILICSLLSILLLFRGNYSGLLQFPQIDSSHGRNLRTTIADTVKYYTQDDIIKTSPYFQKFIPRLLVFDGTKFQAFGLAHKGTEYFETMRYTYRYIDTIPLLVQALKANFPDRFKPGMPPFELLFSDADSPHSECVNQKCPTETFAPMILFGSTPKDDTIFPTLRSFPHPVFTHCLFEYKVNGVETCDWPQKPKMDIPWDTLTDTVIWRGADWPFLHYHEQFRFEGPSELMQRSETPLWKSGDRNAILQDISSNMMDKLSPRWRAAIMSARASGDATPWIDSKFVGGMNAPIHEMLSKHGVVVTGERMDADVMSNYKYQIDYGGGGGTTWEGTLTKLLMPGVLFHHETETKDWYYDLMIPWKHYVPIKWDLSDLWSSFSGAQSHAEQMKQISAEGTRLAEFMLSAEYMEAVYQELFVTYLGKLVKSYQPPADHTQWDDMKAKYLSKGFDLYNIAVCKERVCSMQCRKGLKEDMMFVNGDKTVSTNAAGVLQAGSQAHQEQTLGTISHYQQQLQSPPPQQSLQGVLQQPWQYAQLSHQRQLPQATSQAHQLWHPPSMQEEVRKADFHAQQQWPQAPLSQQQLGLQAIAQLPQPNNPQIQRQDNVMESSSKQSQQSWHQSQNQLNPSLLSLTPQEETPPAQVEQAKKLEDSSYNYILSAGKPKEAAAENQVASKRALETSASVDVANKAFAYIAGMAAPDPTPAPALPTVPPLPDRSSMYIAESVQQDSTDPPRRAASNLSYNDRSSSYVVY